MANQYEDDKNKPQNTVQAPPNPVQSRRMQAGQQQPKATGFTNIQRVIGASQGNRLGSTVAGGVQQAGQQATSALEKSREQFQKGLQESSLATDENKQAAQGLIQRAGQGQIGEQDLSQAQKFREGQFTGPTQLQDAARLGLQASSAEQLGRMGGTEGGRQALLQKFVGRPGYASGQQRLDTLLLGQDREAINQARAAASGLSSQAAREIESAAAQAQTTAQANKQFAEQFTGDVTGRIGGIETALGTALKDTQAREAQKAVDFELLKRNLMGGGQNAYNALQNSNLLPDDIKSQLGQIIGTAQRSNSGYTPGGAANVSTAINRILSGFQEAQGLDTQSLMSKDQAGSFSALNKLLGKEVDVSKAGTFQEGRANVDTKSLQSSKNLLDQINQATGTVQKTSQSRIQDLESKISRNELSRDDIGSLLTGEDLAEYNRLNSKSNVASYGMSKEERSKQKAADLARLQELQKKAQQIGQSQIQQYRAAEARRAALVDRLNRGEF
jgi:hypothetical protein